MRVPVQFGTQYAESVSGPLTQELAQNCYLEQAPQGAKSPVALLGTPGLTLFASNGDGPIRGHHIFDDKCYVVSGEYLYVVDTSGASERVGPIPGRSPVSMADNGLHVWIATGDELYAANYDEIVLVPNGEGISHVTYQDGYLIGVKRGTLELTLSNLDDATAISAADYTTVDAFPDYVVGCISDHRELWAFKETTAEAYYNSGNASFPFERTQMIERGCKAPFSIAKAQNSILWVGDDLQVYAMQGYQPTPISTHAITRALEANPSPQSAEGFVYSSAGHTHYALSLTTGTFVYDLTTGLWHKRSSHGLARWRARGHAWSARWNKHVVGDCVNGNLYYLDEDAYDENSNVLQRQAVGAPIWNNGARFIVDEFSIDIEAGVGIDGNGQGYDPEIMLDFSGNGGKTWGRQLTRKFGSLGDYTARCVWRGLGAHYQWTPRITVSDPVAFRVLGAYARITPLAA